MTQDTPADLPTKADISEQAPLRVPVFRGDFCHVDRRGRVLWAAILASSLGFIDGSVVSIALPAMRQTLDASLGQAVWFSSAYLLTLTSLILTGGALGDRFGLGRVFGGGIALFVLASMACAAAPNASALIAARAVQGIGAAFMVPGSLAVLNRTYPPKERGAAIGFWAGTAALTTALGPIIGGLALTLGGPEMWRAVFAINLPLGGLALWLLFSALRPVTTRSHAPVDLAGATVVTLGLLSIAWSLSQADTTGQFNLPLLLGGIGLLALFVWIEARASAPMMPLDLFRSRVFSTINLYAFFINGALSAVFFFLPMVLIALWDVSEILTAAVYTPLSVFIAGLSRRMGAWSGRIGPKPFLVLGASAIATGYALLALRAGPDTLWTGVLPAMCCIGFGMASFIAPASNAVMGSVQEDRGGIASGVNNAISRMSSMMGIASFGALAAMIYSNGGGTLSFAAKGGDAAHIALSSHAFQIIMASAGTMAAIAALVALLSVPKTGPEQVSAPGANAA